MELMEPVRIRGQRQMEFKLALAGHSIKGGFPGLFLQEVRGVIRILAHPKAGRLCLWHISFSFSLVTLLSFFSRLNADRVPVTPNASFPDGPFHRLAVLFTSTAEMPLCEWWPCSQSFTMHPPPAFHYGKYFSTHWNQLSLINWK